MIRTQAVGVGKIPHPLSSHHSVSLSHFTKPLRFAFSHSFPAVAMSHVPRKRRRRSSKNPSTFLSSSSSLDDNFNITSSSAAVTASSPSSPPPQPEKEEEDDVKRKAPDIPTLFRRFWKVAAPYWWSDDKVQARLQLAAVFALTLGTTGISVGFNFLGRDFYNALANKDQEQFTKQLLYYLGAFAGGIPVSIYCCTFLVLCVEGLCQRNSCFKMEILDDKLLHGTLSKELDILQNTVPIHN